MRGKLILLSGGNGTGKDELARRLPPLLEAQGQQFTSIYGPRANASATAIRDLILSDVHHPDSRLAQAFAWLAQHAETAYQVVIPLLEQGTNIILNRGVESTYVYNILERELEKEHPSLRAAVEEILHDLSPDLVLVLDTSVETSLARSGQQNETDHLQREAHAVHAHRRAIYQRLAQEHDWNIIDATPAAEAVAQAAADCITEKLANEKGPW